MQRMLILNSAWPFAAVRDPGFTVYVYACAHVAEFFYPCNFSLSLSLCNNTCVCMWTWWLCEFNSEPAPRPVQPATGWLAKLEGWTIGYLGNRRENHSILLAAHHHARGESSSQKTLRCIILFSSLSLSFREFCGFPFPTFRPPINIPQARRYQQFRWIKLMSMQNL